MARRGRPRSPDILTPREWEVLDLLRQGLSNPEIAERLGIGREGVKYHVSEILNKLGVNSREEAARWQPEVRQPWWAGSLAPFAIGWHKASSSVLAMAASAVTIAVVTAGAGLLIWGLIITHGTSPSSASFLAGDIPTPCDRVGEVPIPQITTLPPEKRAIVIRQIENCVQAFLHTPSAAELTNSPKNPARRTPEPTRPPTPTLGPPLAGTPACKARDIQATAGLQGAGMNQVLGALIFANHGPSACALTGWPTAQVLDPSGNILPVKATDACPQASCDARFGIVVGPGQEAAAEMSSITAVPEACLGATRPAQTGSLLVTLSGGEQLSISLGPGGDDCDPSSSSITVGPYAPRPQP